MNKDLLDKQFEIYISHFPRILGFLKKNFGEGDYLEMRFQDLIPKRNYGLKNEFGVSGYSFHGFGCGFQFKNQEIDIEFCEGKTGFTSWSFYTFLPNEYVSERDVTSFLNLLVEEGRLEYLKNIYIPCYTG